MKRNKILLTALLCAVLLTVFSVMAFASTDTGECYPSGSESDTSINAEIDAKSDADIDNATKPDDTPAPGAPDDPQDGDTVENGDITPTDENVFELLFEKVKHHAGEIFSALALVASLVLAYFYKCGLMPIIQNALSAISSVLTGIEKGADESSKASAEAIGALKSRLESAESVIDRLNESMTVMTDDLKARDAEASDAADTRVILSAQVDMLYDIFMTSALPQYQKDAVGEKIAAMRGVLAENDNKQTD